MRGNYRDYSHEEKAACIATLAACGGNSWVAAKETGVPRKTLEHWQKQDAGVSEETANLAAQKQIDLAQWFEDHARKALHLADRRIEDPEVPYQQTITGAAIAVDKMRLLRDQSTENHAHAIKSIEERDALLASILREIDSNPVIEAEFEPVDEDT